MSFQSLPGVLSHPIVALDLLDPLLAETKMSKKTSTGLILCVGTICALSFASGQKAEDTESVRLISSIQGPQLYDAYCAVCHGKDGKGTGPMAKSLKPVTPDLTRIAMRNGGDFRWLAFSRSSQVKYRPRRGMEPETCRSGGLYSPKSHGIRILAASACTISPSLLSPGK